MNLFNLSAKLVLDKDSYDKGISDAKKSTKDFGASSKQMAVITASAWLSVAQAVVGVAKQIADATLGLVNYADKFSDLSAQYDISTKSLQEFNYIAVQSSTSMDEMLSVMTAMYNRAKEGDSAFIKYGIAVRDMNGNMKTMEQLFWEAQEAISGITNSGEQSTAMLELFGRSANNLGEILRKDTKDLKAMVREANESGAIMSDRLIKAASDFNDKLATWQVQAKGIFTALLLGEDGAEELFDKFFDDTFDKINRTLPSIIKMIVKAAAKIITTIADNVDTIIDAFLEALYSVNWVEVALKIGIALLKGIVKVLNPANLWKAFRTGINSVVSAFTGQEYVSAFSTGSTSSSLADLMGTSTESNRQISASSNYVQPSQDDYNFNITLNSVSQDYDAKVLANEVMKELATKKQASGR